MPGRTALVVVSYGSHALLAANLAPLNLPSTVLVVAVDNPTTPAERAAMVELTARHGWALVAPTVNLGFGAGANAGAARALAAGCDVLVFVNPDAEVSTEVVRALASDVRDRQSTMVAPLIDRGDGRPWFRKGVLDVRTGHVSMLGTGEQPLAWLSGAVLAVHADLWGRLGGFAEEFFMYWEDVDLAQRCLAAGGALAVREDLLAVHDVGGTQGAVKSHLYFRYNCRNRLLFAARNLARTDVLRWLAGTPRQSWSILLRGGRRRLLQDPGALAAGVAGTLDGVRLAAVAAARTAGTR